MLNYNILQSIHDKCDLITQENMRKTVDNVKTNPLCVYITKYCYMEDNWVDPDNFLSYHFMNDAKKIKKIGNIYKNGGDFLNYCIKKNFLENDSFVLITIELNKIYNCLNKEDKDFDKIPLDCFILRSEYYSRVDEISKKQIFNNQCFNKLYTVLIYICKRAEDIKINKSMEEESKDYVKCNIFDEEQTYDNHDISNSRILRFYTNHQNNIEYIINTQFKNEIKNDIFAYHYEEIRNNYFYAEEYILKFHNKNIIKK
jgi:hypothetical protein